MTKECLWHEHEGKQKLPLSEFGLNAAYEKWGAGDGRSIYCRTCCKKRTEERRSNAREEAAIPCLCGCGEFLTPGRRYRLGHCFKGMPKSAEWRMSISESMKNRAHQPEQRVLFAIKEGARTQTQIKTKAKVYDEQLGLALVQLMLVEKKVISRVNNGERFYFVRSEAA